MKPVFSPTNTPHLKYRADIDGLRAIAVLAVVAYHAFPKKIQGGFIGVDIFFIISGFLISTILFQSLEVGNYSTLDFYRRRIKRIFPALLLVLTGTLLFGWFFLLSDEYRQLGKHVAGGAGFISNFLLWGEAGYFDSSADAKPLLHLWSLAVEEQFYIFWPLILAATWKKHWNFLVIVFLAIISFSFNLFYVSDNSTAAFYSPLSRFWELMIGSMLAYVLLYKPKLIEKYKNVQSVFGFCLLVLGFILIDHARHFPGWWALFPTLGATLIISAGPKAFLNRHVLSSKMFVWFGLISYPLYLWHWPIFSFLHIVVSASPSRNIKLMAIAISILLAWLTYRLIEKPLRAPTVGRRATVSLAMIMVLVGTAGYYCFYNGGLEGTGYRMAGKNEFSRYFDNAYPEWHYTKTQGLEEKYREDCNFYDISKYLAGKETTLPRQALPSSCYERDRAYTKSVFLWGDSHAEHLNYGLRKNLPANWQILQVASSACPASADVAAPSAINYCEQSNWFAMQALKKAQPDVVIVSQSSDHNAGNFNVLASRLKAIGIQRVIFAGPVPHWNKELPRLVLRDLWESTPQRTFIGLDKDVVNNNEDIKKNFMVSDGIFFADLMAPFCNADGCSIYLGDDKMIGLTAWDSSHLTPVASDFVARKLLVGMILKADAGK
ncbi:acyltransferase family protein [Janthinobacterium rivuli]|uniref:Acyltransferase family protein n=1 Tax=Janthinobacterium rivuli TaxID=2751478 RepID=A0ABY8HZX6_9BURK|nr:acyltransferase family protein [Janthinobacterium rivuli]WFR77799.1 acyltransferase family protein [Janthinobacterium rivuli]